MATTLSCLGVTRVCRRVASGSLWCKVRISVARRVVVPFKFVGRSLRTWFESRVFWVVLQIERSRVVLIILLAVQGSRLGRTLN